jgi:hypothetical protein
MFESNTDMPDQLRKGLSTDQQTIVRGMVNFLVYEENVDAGLAVSKAQKALVNAGYTWSGSKWEGVVGKKIATGMITKTMDDKRLAFGWANVITKDGKILVDRQDDFVDDPWELEKAAYDYVISARVGGEMHERTGVSTLVESMVFTKEKIEKMGIPQGMIPEGWWVGFKVTEESVWELVKTGEYPGFSIHGRGVRKEMDLDHRHSRVGV